MTRPVTQPGLLAAHLSPLPLAALSLPDDTLAALTGIGVRNLGGVLALPADQLARRFGAGVVAYLRRLIGEAPTCGPLWEPPPQYRRRFEMTGGIDSIEG